MDKVDGETDLRLTALNVASAPGYATASALMKQPSQAHAFAALNVPAVGSLHCQGAHWRPSLYGSADPACCTAEPICLTHV